jgi:hypothetical protein
MSCESKINVPVCHFVIDKHANSWNKLFIVVTFMKNYLHGYKSLCCQNLAYCQTEIKWSFFVEHLNSWFAGTHKNHENWYTTNKNEFTVLSMSVAYIFGVRTLWLLHYLY